MLYVKANLNVLSPVESRGSCYFSIRKESLKKRIRDLDISYVTFVRIIEKYRKRVLSVNVVNDTEDFFRDRSVWIMDDPHDDFRR